MYNAYNYGGYLMYLGYPDQGVFVDGRAITVYPEAFLAEFDEAYRDPRRFEALFARYRCDSVLLPTTSERVAPLRAHLDTSPRFRRLHRDSIASVYVPAGAP